LETALRFLTALDPSARAFNFRAFDDKKRLDRRPCMRHASLENCSRELAQLNAGGYGVFVTVNETDGRGKKAKNIVRVRAVFADLDGAPLDPVLKCELKPHMIVETSPGKYHAYWLVDGLPLDQFEAVQRVIIARFGSDPSVKDLPRVMRLPGFWHRKGEPFLTRLLEVRDDPPYSAAEILVEFPPTTKAKLNGHAAPVARAASNADLDGLCKTVREATEGSRNADLNKAGFAAGQMIAAGGVARDVAEAALRAAARDCGLGDAEIDGTLPRAIEAGMKAPPIFVTDKHGQPYPSQHNIRVALRRLGVRLAYDQFAVRELIEGLADFGPELTDAAVTRVWLLIDQQFRFRAAADFFWSVIGDQARKNSFHPVRDYLAGLTWDGVPRLDRWLPTYGGAEDAPYVRAVGALTLIAAVRRIRQPGCKFDEMPVLVGPQGVGKSSALAALAGKEDWFTDDLPLSADTKLVIERLRGRWIVEAAELKGMRKSDIEHMKSFLSRQVDRARMAYARRVEEVPRQCVFIGTTNSDQFLRDGTGNRRYWPVVVRGFDLEALARDRDQLWAEAAGREAAGESIRLDPSLYVAAAEAQDQRAIADPWIDRLASVLGDLNGKMAAETAWQVVGLPAGQRAQEHNARLGEAMKALGWGRTKRRINRHCVWVYARGTALERARTIVVDIPPGGAEPLARYEDQL